MLSRRLRKTCTARPQAGPPSAAVQSDLAGVKFRPFRVLGFRKKLPGQGALNATLGVMLFSHVREPRQDWTAHRDALAPAAVDPNATHVDHRFTGTQRERPGLGKAQAACRNRDTVVVTKLDRLARSLPDSRNIAAIDRAKP